MVDKKAKTAYNRITKGSVYMNTIIQRTLKIIDDLDETAQISVLRFAEFLAAENDNDIALYDEAKADDDGYRINSDDLRIKYGI